VRLWWQLLPCSESSAPGVQGVSHLRTVCQGPRPTMGAWVHLLSPLCYALGLGDTGCLCSSSAHILLELLIQVVGLHLGSASAPIWRLYSVDGPLVDGVIKSYAGWCFHLFCHSPARLPPLVWRWMAIDGARMCYERCYHQLQGGSSCLVSPGLHTFCHF